MVIQIRTNKVLNDLEFYEPNSACHPSTQFDQINQEINKLSIFDGNNKTSECSMA